MPASRQLSWNEIRSRAHAFVKEWRDESRERAEKDSFWNDFFHVYGVNRRRYVTFERNVTKLKGTAGYIDGFWPGMILVEHKSRGKDLDAALKQAQEYLDVLPQHELPRFVVISDFAEFRVWDMDENTRHAFPIEELADKVELFAPLAGYRPVGYEEEDAVNVKAAALLGELHDLLDATGYHGHALRMLLVRILFLLFADDTGVWEKSIFSDYLRNNTAEDGRDLGMHLQGLFEVLDTPEKDRQSSLDEALAQFPYINGDLFAERIPTASFDTAMRECLLNCSRFDWAGISPAIFGSMFQSVMDEKERRQIGAHYTTEANILKLIDPLFLDGLRAEFTNITTLAPKRQKERLKEFKEKLGGLTFFDPACGCGNFLLIAYRELRLLELEALKKLRDMDKGGQQFTLDALAESVVTVDQFYGIEYEEFPARIAQTAMYLMDHLMNQRLSQEFGLYYARFPIESSAHIVCSNALRMDWRDLLVPGHCSYIMGNPPFVGMSLMDKEQQEDNRHVFSTLPIKAERTGRLDYVACWYAKSVDYMQGTSIRAALVSTNSITQGEQARSIGPMLSANGFEIIFGHRTFNWSSEARGKAAVHVVIVGFAAVGLVTNRRLFTYDGVRGLPTEQPARALNIYLAESSVSAIGKHSKPIVDGLPKLTEGNRPQDGGGLIVTPEERDEILATDPIATRYLRRLVGAHDMLNGESRWCLWLTDAQPSDLLNSPTIRARMPVVADARLKSPTESAKKRAKTPSLFFSIRQPDSRWLCVPRHSSENRAYVPMAFFSPDDIAHDSTLTINGAPDWLFALLQSSMFTAWIKGTSGRIKSDVRISPDLSYNAFPFPALTDKDKAKLAGCCAAVLAARDGFSTATLAQLYAPTAMPAALVEAHDQLDRVVDRLYGGRSALSEDARLDLLFSRYEELTQPQPGLLP